MKITLRFLLIFISFVLSSHLNYTSLFAQVELVSPTNSVYDFLDRMLINKIIDSYTYSMKPVSRREIGVYLTEIQKKRTKLTKSDKLLLDFYLTEFEFDIKHTLKNSSSFFPGWKFSDVFSKKQKYCYATYDSNYSFFLDGIGELKYMGADGDSIGKPHILLGQAGLRLRGTLFNTVGYYLRISNGVRLDGTEEDAVFAAQFDPILASTRKFVSEKGKTFDTYEGYLRFSPSPSNWLGLTVGREALTAGAGFIDKLVMSQNTAPFDFIKLDLRYKKFNYSFLHSSITGYDSNNVQLSSKYFVYHRLEIGPLFKDFMKLGFSEMLIYSNIPINLAFINPLSFLTSAELNTELPGKNSNNALLEIDLELFPVKKLSLQGSILIDDLNFETLGKTDKTGNDNKFAFQAGLSWQDAFLIPNMNFIYEYTRIDPFVYSHREINNSYTNWNQPIGPALNPNSDEHAIKLAYTFGPWINIALTFKHQRTGLNITDSTGKIITNVGSDILYGKGDFLIKNEFLNGIRLDRNIIIAEITLQPVRQYFFSFKYQNRGYDYLASGRNLNDNIFWGSFRVDY